MTSAQSTARLAKRKTDRNGHQKSRKTDPALTLSGIVFRLPHLIKTGTTTPKGVHPDRVARGDRFHRDSRHAVAPSAQPSQEQGTVGQCLQRRFQDIQQLLLQQHDD